MSLINSADDFFGKYLPSSADISTSLAEAKRTAATLWFQAGFPDINNTPGTVFGDMYVTPLALSHAATEQAVTRLLGDVDLANIARGGAFNCEVASAFVSNFEQTSYDGVARGLLRLVFSDDLARSLPGDIQFQINGDVFSTDLPTSGVVEIQKVGSAYTSGTNSFALKQEASGRYSVSIPVAGETVTTVTAGNPVTVLRYTIEGLIDLAVDYDFYAGNSVTLVARAELAQKLFPVTNGNSRAGLEAAVLRAFPEMLSVCAIMPWDAAMTRQTDVLLGSRTSADIFVRSPNYGAKQTQDVVFTRGAGNFLIAELSLAYPAILFDSFTASDASVWDAGDVRCQIVTVSTDDNVAPLCTSAGTEYQRVFAILDLDGHDDLSADSSTDDVPGYTVSVVYRTEPMVRHVSENMLTDSRRPFNADVVVRPFIPVVVSSFVVRCTQLPGQRINTTQATKELLAYLQSCGGSKPVSYARVCEIMTYANAADVMDVVINAEVWFSPGRYVLAVGEELPTVDYTAYEADRRAVPSWVAVSLRNLATTAAYRDPLVGVSGETLASLTRNNIALLIDADAIVIETV